MRIKYLLASFILSLSLSAFAQKVVSTKVTVPDSVKAMCDKLFKKELGEQLFKSCLKFDSATGTKTLYAVYYSFSYPGVKESSVHLKMNYSVFSGKGRLQSDMFLRLNQTDLPKDIQEKGEKVIGYNEAKNIALKADSSLKNAQGDFVLSQKAFYWHFSYSYENPNPGGDAETMITHTVIIDPYSGKVTANYTK